MAANSNSQSRTKSAWLNIIGAANCYHWWGDYRWAQFLYRKVSQCHNFLSSRCKKPNSIKLLTSVLLENTYQPWRSGIFKLGIIGQPNLLYLWMGTLATIEPMLFILWTLTLVTFSKSLIELSIIGAIGLTTMNICTGEFYKIQD